MVFLLAFLLSGHYLENAGAFISYFRESNNLKTPILVVDRSGGHFFDDCEGPLLKDTAMLSDAERKEFISELDHPILPHWTPHLLGDSAQIISQDTVDRCFSSGRGREAWQLFQRKYGSKYMAFSAPIFLRDDTVCLFYFEILCGPLCGEGQLNFYEKVEGRWRLIKTYCNWMR